MHVDDRLATVLDVRADGKVTMGIQYRQLLDLVGTAPAAARSDMIDAAYVRLAELSAAIPPAERARALAEPGVRLRNPRLLAELAADEPIVTLAAIRGAKLSDDEWLDLIPALPAQARNLLRLREDLPPMVAGRLEQLGIADRALPPAVSASAPQAAEAVPEPVRQTRLPESLASINPDGIGALVRRIEAFRRNRDAVGPGGDGDAPRLPLDDSGEPRAAPVEAFAFSTDTAGRIGWAEPGVAPMVVGLLLTGAVAPDLDVAELVHQRMPVRGGSVILDGAPAITGAWCVDAAPDFNADGHFIGYLGRFRRPAPPAPEPANAEFDRIRQVLHELRTPVNAIQGFAEVIQQQLFGPTPHEYRALAAGIAADAARILAGFSELDRLARLDGGSLTLDPGGCDLAMVVAGTIHQLEAFTGARSSGFSFTAPPGEQLVAMTPTDAEQLIWRLLATIAGAARPGEVLPIALAAAVDGVSLSITLPEAMAALDDLFDAAPPAAPQAVSSGMFGTGFALRLAAAEARAVGGRLDRAGSMLELLLPAGERDQSGSLTSDADFHNPAKGLAAGA